MLRRVAFLNLPRPPPPLLPRLTTVCHLSARPIIHVLPCARQLLYVCHAKPDQCIAPLEANHASTKAPDEDTLGAWLSIELTCCCSWRPISPSNNRRQMGRLKSRANPPFRTPAVFLGFAPAGLARHSAPGTPGQPFVFLTKRPMTTGPRYPRGSLQDRLHRRLSATSF